MPFWTCPGPVCTPEHIRSPRGSGRPCQAPLPGCSLQREVPRAQEGGEPGLSGILSSLAQSFSACSRPGWRGGGRFRPAFPCAALQAGRGARRRHEILIGAFRQSWSSLGGGTAESLFLPALHSSGNASVGSQSIIARGKKTRQREPGAASATPGPVLRGRPSWMQAAPAPQVMLPRQIRRARLGQASCCQCGASGRPTAGSAAPQCSPAAGPSPSQHELLVALSALYSSVDRLSSGLVAQRWGRCLSCGQSHVSGLLML